MRGKIPKIPRRVKPKLIYILAGVNSGGKVFGYQVILCA